ncbi:GH1 family beta-glucosidase [Actinomadura parmotrematis]|uniref:Beta-glucosidase n=1 Tax=Actinomadura parmotrematis TaxID=2864039 RepID=A0ABS7G3C5_9ACTN|nr:GH1 family beta-glucosidase [Actinomadura parmotrematis]MBW8487187.1 beta-glucosidase [Actinomadura parmotrematis]
MNELDSLPAGFTWGVATSSYQIEGAVAEDGRTPSIWDTFAHAPGNVDGGHTGDVACDHYHRWPEDIALMKGLGVDAYRFSIAWPRVVPDGAGAVNAAGLAFYDRLVDGLLEAGITPFPTLYHWDLPQALQDRGGWADRATAERFAEYAAATAAVLGDRITSWATLNEPMCAAWIGHIEGRHAPGVRDLAVAVPAAYHLLLAHGLGAAAVRSVAPGARVGLVNLVNPAEPATGSDADARAAERFDGHVNRWWLDPVFGRGLPADMVELYERNGARVPVRAGDLAAIAAPLDWLGVNFYNPCVLADDPDGPVPHARETGGPGERRTMLGWEIRAEGLERTLLRVHEDYAPAEILVTENGSAWADEVGPDGTVDDPGRVRYLEEHLAACGRAAAKGVPLSGYFAWSLMDNFEWAFGYDARFGLVHVDYPTQRRTVKASGRRYAAIIAAQREAARGTE